MGEVSARIVRRAQADFGTSADHVIDKLKRISLIGPVDHERVLAAIVTTANGDWRALDEAIALAELDWRDVLMGTGFEHEGWERTLDEEFGPAD